MLELKQIVKDYPVGNNVVHALKGVDLRFRTSEFVSVLGPSGCGKTTLLNIVGGLDQYTTGDLVIDGVSTKAYKDRDWDTYRNHSIGFVFQTYNLIPHQSVLKNVELALTLAGVPKSERKARAEEALVKVGLGEHMHKRPNQLSGGQMQRVAIARAIVNDPDIILADEPTGALDTETGIQIMELMREMSRDRLVVMVTHNPELAMRYSTRIINILDGEIVGDSAPLTEEEYVAEKQAEEERANAQQQTTTTQGKRTRDKKRSSMSFWTAFKLSLNNLFTKKGRTLLTSFAGSIGIIGIALILSVSQGMTNYINLVEEQTLTSYPLTIESTTMDLSAMVTNMMESQDNKQEHARDKVYKRSMIYDLVNMVSGSAQKSNDLQPFKKFLEEEVAKEDSELHSAIAGLQYSYDLNLNVYTKNPDGDIIESDVGDLMRQLLTVYLENVEASTGQYYMPLGSFSMDIWQELLPGTNGEAVNDVVKDQYDLVYGDWPIEHDQVVLVLNSDNEISDIALYALGLIGQDYVDAVADAIRNNTKVEDTGTYNNWDYKEICGKEAKVILDSDCYMKTPLGTWSDMREQDAILKQLYNNSLTLEIVGIVRPNPDATAHMLTGTIGYTQMLTKYVIEQAEKSEAVKEQKQNPSVDIFTGMTFGNYARTLPNADKKTNFLNYYNSLSDDNEKLNVYAQMYCLDNNEEVTNSAKMVIKAKYADHENPDKIDRNRLVSQFAPLVGIAEDEALKMIEGMTDEQLVDMLCEVPQFYSTIEEQYKAEIVAQLNMLPKEQRDAMIQNYLDGRSEDQFATYHDEILEFSDATYESNLIKLGSVDIDKPTAVHIYASSFDAKDVIAAEIDRYNKNIADEDQQITYTDLVALVMTAVTTIVNAVTYVLIAFVAISLIVSSIMIGVITLISVQERTKEIGILRAIGASKRDVAHMFNAETIIIGFVAGMFGILFTYLLCIPVNLILHALTGIGSLNAVLPPLAALILVAISVVLTLFSGLIPSRSASKKDPVVALRTE